MEQQAEQTVEQAGLLFAKALIAQQKRHRELQDLALVRFEAQGEQFSAQLGELRGELEETRCAMRDSVASARQERADGPDGGEGCSSNRSETEPCDPGLEIALARMRAEIRDSIPSMVEGAFRNFPPLPAHMFNCAA